MSAACASVLESSYGVEPAVHVPLDGEPFGVVANPGVLVLKELTEFLPCLRLALAANAAAFTVCVLVLIDHAAIAALVDSSVGFAD